MPSSERPLGFASIAHDGWELESGEDRRTQYDEKFWLPPREERDALHPGQSVKLLFQIEAVDENGNAEIGVERMWVVVLEKLDGCYRGVLDNQPVSIEAGHLDEGTELLFRPEHVIDIDQPPDDYLRQKYGDRLQLGRAG
jgi:hypothetical protein